jgi:uncharacterized damage-inducible protein DinB
MNYYGGKELAAAFRTVRKNTIQVAEDVPESKYDFKVAPDVRSVGQTLVHIALAPDIAYHIHSNRIDNLMNVNFPELIQKITGEESKPRTKAEIIALLRSQGEKFASYLEGLPDSFLAERVNMPPGADPAAKSRFEMLLSSKEHEMHHRAQLMTVQRIIGIVPHLTRQRQEQMARAQSAQR